MVRPFLITHQTIFKQVTLSFFLVSGLLYGISNGQTIDVAPVETAPSSPAVKDSIDIRKNRNKKDALYQLPTMSVISTRPKRTSLMQTTSVVTIRQADLKQTAGTANDIDLYLGTLPSVVSGVSASFDNNIIVRGGHSTENVYLVDGMEMESISHFSSPEQSGGAIGFINTEFVKDIDFYAGGMPAGLPSRLSSVVDIHLREGLTTQNKTRFDINASGFGLLAEGPIPAVNGSYLVNGRYVHLAVLKPFIPVMRGTPCYGDGQLKFTSNFGKSHSINGNLLYANDIYAEPQSLYRWRTDYYEKVKQDGANLRWNYGTGQFRSAMQLSSTSWDGRRYEQFKVDEVPTSFKGDNPRIDFVSQKAWLQADVKRTTGIKTDVTLSTDGTSQFDAGISYSQISYRLQNHYSLKYYHWYVITIDSIFFDTLLYKIDPYAVDSTLNDAHTAAYLQYGQSFDHFRFYAGLRADYFHLFHDRSLSPRIAASLNLENWGTFSFSSGIYYQMPAKLNELFFEIVVAEPSRDPVSVLLEDFALQRNLQAVLSYEWTKRNQWAISAETYFKWYDREYPFENPDELYFEREIYKEGAKTWCRFNQPQGKKKAYGLELLLRSVGNQTLTYSAGYSLFAVQNKYSNGSWYADNNEVRNSLTLTMGYTVNQSHSASLRLSASEGLPYSSMIIVPIDEFFSEAIFDTTEGYNTKRFDPILSLSLRYQYTTQQSWGHFSGYIDLLNCLNQTPILKRAFRVNRFIYRRKSGILPVAGITLTF
ncbi:MAG: TonB-dependent receptor plug domain-containing protein [Chitinivibrionales bacterium]|nr:TonB-dependent receptor plug domain-containing protein [Chitinivibrionales bacterium]